MEAGWITGPNAVEESVWFRNGTKSAPAFSFDVLVEEFDVLVELYNSL